MLVLSSRPKLSNLARNGVNMAKSGSLSIAIVLYGGFSNLVLACLHEPLRALRDQGRADIRWFILTPDDLPAESSSGLRIAPDLQWADMEQVDLLAVIAGYGYLRHANLETGRTLRMMARKADTVIGADTAPWLLAAAGLMSNARATIHWTMLAEFAETFPELDVRKDRFVTDGRLWTCGGASTALDLVLHLIKERFGTASAFDVSTMFLHDAARDESMRRGPARLSTQGSKKLVSVLRVMAANVEAPLSLDALAIRSGISARSLNRLFQNELGMAPGKYYQLLRLSHAREMASETQASLREVALRCGFANAASLSKAFSRSFGHPIGDSRRQGIRNQWTHP